MWGDRGAFLHALVRRRRQVTAYVTREHPETGFDELLVFDFPDEPEFSAVVPGGGIEAGETVAEAAIREVREETGIEVEFVRELGVGENPGQKDPELVHEATSSSQGPAWSAGPWEHRSRERATTGGLVSAAGSRCGADAEVWGLRGDFIHALVRKRVVGYVTRSATVSTSSSSSTTRPAGCADAGPGRPHRRARGPRDGPTREVEEETGLTASSVVGELADADEVDRLYGLFAHRSGRSTPSRIREDPDAWDHS